MKLNEERLNNLIDILKLYLIAGLLYVALFIYQNENGDMLKAFNLGILEYLKISILPLTALCITTLQFSIAYNNREIARKKNLIDLEDKSIKEFAEIKEILEGIIITPTDSYKELLINLKVKDKSVEEKLLDKWKVKDLNLPLNTIMKKLNIKNKSKKCMVLF